MNDQSSYRQVLRATSIFGGVQVFNILISIVRSKAIALLLGPAGMGIAGLLNNAVSVIGMTTNLGLDASAVKTIAMSNDVANPQKSAVQITVISRLNWITGILGGFATAVFSTPLSRLTFGTTDYAYAFLWLGLAVLLRQLSNGQLAVLQGLRKIEVLAKANLWGAFAGLVFALPFYYFWGVDGIAPAIVMTMLATFAINSFYCRSDFKIQKMSFSQLYTHASPIVKLGFSLGLIGIITTIAGYVLQIYIGYAGGPQQVGLFSAGFAIVNSYVGLIFNAMATDYFPRLASVSANAPQMRNTVEQQAHTAVLILTPIVVGFLAIAPWIIRLLYSAEFISVVTFVSWGLLGMVFKAVSWSMGYILIAKADSKIFIATSIGFNSVFLALNITGYRLYGLEGLGISFMVNHLIHFIMLGWITRRRYDFYFKSGFYKTYFICLVCCAAAFTFTYISDLYLRYALLLLTSVAASVYCVRQLNEKTNLMASIRTKWERK